MKVISPNNAPILNNAGNDTTKANKSFLIPFAACESYSPVTNVDQLDSK